MTLFAGLLALPCVLMLGVIGLDGYFRQHPGKDDIWLIPKRSSLH